MTEKSSKNPTDKTPVIPHTEYNGVPLHRGPGTARWGFYLGVEVGIRPILSPVASNSCQILKLTISLVLLGLLSGCGAIGGAALSGALM